MAPAPTPIPDALPGPVFTTAEARACGITATQLRGRRFRRLRRGLHALADVALQDVDLARAICRSDARAVIVGLTAARLLDMPLPHDTRALPLRVSTTPDRRPRSDGLIDWRRQLIPAGDVVISDGVRITTRTRTWADLADALSHDDLVVIADHLLRTPRSEHEHRRVPFASVDDLRVAAGGSARASVRLRSALLAARAGADSPQETRLRLACVRAGLPEPQVNPVLEVPGGGRHQPDLLWARFGVCAEYDGGHHRTPEQFARDIRRRERARRCGLLEVAITSGDLRWGARSATERIAHALAERGWSRQASEKQARWDRSGSSLPAP